MGVKQVTGHKFTRVISLLLTRFTIKKASQVTVWPFLNEQIYSFVTPHHPLQPRSRPSADVALGGGNHCDTVGAHSQTADGSDDIVSKASEVWAPTSP